MKFCVLEHVDVVVVTHEHGDHWVDAIEVAQRFDAYFVGIYETAQKAAQKGVKKAVGMNIGGPGEVEGLKIALTPAFHSGLPVGIVISSGSETLYHAGDTGLFTDMKLISELFHPDVALLPIGGFFTMDPEQAAIATTLLKPKVAIPMHYNTFPVIRQDPELFRKLVAEKAPDVEVVILKPGEYYEYKK
ncbi:metal-dependent hydrolase [Thermococci archaeon]|nr:MAG: metal-dependent hydrolase [Thermococci archaeon]